MIPSKSHGIPVHPCVSKSLGVFVKHSRKAITEQAELPRALLITDLRRTVARPLCLLALITPDFQGGHKYIHALSIHRYSTESCTSVQE